MTDKKLNTLELVKEYLSEEKYRIKLDDLINYELRNIISKYSADNFKKSDSFAESLKMYEEVTEHFQSIVTAICYWGTKAHAKTLERIFTRQVDAISDIGGWESLRYYPILLLQYFGGISALAAGNYELLKVILSCLVHDVRRNRSVEITGLVIEKTTDLHRGFKTIPGYERYHVPRSEYLFKLMRSKLDEILFLGKSYEDLFDRFEIFLTLTYSDFNNRNNNSDWGPPGRFVWKRYGGSSVFIEFKTEADNFKNEWEPIKTGLFQGSYDRFVQVHNNMSAIMSEWHFL